MNASLQSKVGTWLDHMPPLVQRLVAVLLVFLFAFGADALLQRVIELFVAGIVEQDAFFYSAVRQQDAFAQNILVLLKEIVFFALGVGFVLTLLVLLIPLFARTRSRQPFQSDPRRLLKATLLALRGIATVTFVFLVLNAIYQLLLRIIGNQPPFFLLAALVIAAMYQIILVYSLVVYANELRARSIGSHSAKEEEAL